MTPQISRRNFLKLSALGLGAMAFRPLSSFNLETPSNEIGRVAIKAVSIYSQPDDKSTIVGQRFRDELLNIYYDVVSDKGPGYNPLWYRVWKGYVHSAHVVKVENCLNPVLDSVPNTGQLAEVTVPYSQSYRITKAFGWQSLYRLYYGSLHWIIGVEDGPDGQPWYRIRDELLRAEEENYFAPAIHFRPVAPEEYTPLSADVPPDQKRIEVDLSTQRLVAYEYDKEIFRTIISSGIPNKETNTPKGTFYVFQKNPSKHMGETGFSRDGTFTDDPEAYILIGIPWVSFFVENGIGFHGTYWHNNFGMTMSHGCINMKTEEAKWIYRWTTPTVEANKMELNGTGTKVKVF
jgi:hypothetical protein